MYLGAIADDLTGATDLSLMLSREGMAVVQVVGVPAADLDLSDADAVVVSLKSRTIPVDAAVGMSLAALEALQKRGAQQIFFKYCSTFDSTDMGNIGPVIDALMARMGIDRAIVCPAFPATGRRVFRGHLFVGDQLLSDSSMKDHPLTPMRDSNLMRLLGRQSRQPITLISHEVLAQGEKALHAAFEALQGLAVVDAINDHDLRLIGKAGRNLPLITGGSGVSLGLPANFQDAQRRAAPQQITLAPGRTVLLAGSCSTATRRQVEVALAAGVGDLKLDALAIAEGRLTPDMAIEFCLSHNADLPPLIWSSAPPELVEAAHARLGRERAGALIETFLAQTATGLAEHGFNRFIVAGGETSGAVVNGLAVPALEIGPEIDPGVPWTRSRGCVRPMALALKSGNFGAEDFFLKAWKMLP